MSSRGSMMVRNTVHAARSNRGSRTVPRHHLLSCVALLLLVARLPHSVGAAFASIPRANSPSVNGVVVTPFLSRGRSFWGGPRIGPLRLSNAESPPPEQNDESKNKANNDKNEEEELVVPAMIPREELLIGDDFASSSSLTSGVDWDAEWKKVVRQQKQSGGIASNKQVDRPGKGYYKSEAEIAAIKAANRATEGARRAASQLPSIPSWKSLQGDWKVRCLRSKN